MAKNTNNYLNFIKHNQNIFLKNEKKNNNLFLIEFNGWQGVQIANSYLVNSIPYIKNCRLVAYDFYRDYKKNNFFFFDNLKWFIGSLIKIRNFGIYASYGVDKFLIRITNYLDFFKAKKYLKIFFPKKKLKETLKIFLLMVYG